MFVGSVSRSRKQSIGRPSKPDDERGHADDRFVFDQKIIPEPAKHTQELYGALDTVVQAVLTDKNADPKALLQGVNKQVQALIDADAKK